MNRGGQLDRRVLTSAASSRSTLFRRTRSPAAAEAAVLPYAVVTDLHLPGLSGLALVENLRESLPHLRAVFITGSDSPDNLPAGTSMLQKPFSPEELIERLTAPRPESKGAVLVVDDDDNIRCLLRRTLESAGYTVV